MDFRKGIVRSFATLFREQVVDEGVKGDNSFSKFWGYYIWISQLSEDKVWKVNSITSQPLILCLNHLSYLSDLRSEQEKAIKKQMKQQK
jgi:hypothetical protein